MKNITEYILVTGVVVGVTLGANNNVANANLRNRISTLFSNLCRSCIRREPHQVTENLIIQPDLKNKVNDLAYNNKLSGEDINNFDYSKISLFNENIYYYQVKESGETITLASLHKPILRHLDKNEVGVKYRTPENKVEIIKTEGVPIWLKGSEIYHESKNRFDQKMKRYFESMDGVQPDNYYGLQMDIDYDEFSSNSFSSGSEDSQKSFIRRYVERPKNLKTNDEN